MYTLFVRNLTEEHRKLLKVYCELIIYEMHVKLLAHLQKDAVFFS
jgi:pullulanase/glycogen debranching enzyme